MDTLQNQLNEIHDELVLRLVTQMAKPTVTLTQLKDAASKHMEDLELRGSLGRLWRAVKIYRRGLTGGVVLYWPEEKLKVVASSGIQPEMPEGRAMPDAISHIINPVAKEFEKQEAKAEAKEERLTKHEENMRKSKWQLVPISQTAALPMRPLPEGAWGTARRGTVVTEVLSAIFMYRDVRMSIDGFASLLPHVSRVDVARVISQTVNGTGKKYILRFDGETRFDNTYQWNHEFCYPFPSREADDGARVAVRNADPEVTDDEPLDHLKPEELTEDETESEIARLIRQQQEQATEEKVEEKVETNGFGFPVEEPKQESKPEDHYVYGEGNKVIGVRGQVGDKGCGHAERVLTSEEILRGDLLKDVGTVNEQQDAGRELSLPEIEILEEQKRTQTFDSVESGRNYIGALNNGRDTIAGQVHKREGDPESLNVTTVGGTRRVSANSDKFRVALFDDDELVLHFGQSTIELTPEQTQKVMMLLGPRYLAGLKAA